MTGTKVGAPPSELGPPLEACTACEAFQRTVGLYGDRVALRTRRDEVSLTWSELNRRVKATAAALAAAGIGHGDTVASLLPNIPEVHIVDYAAMHMGAVPFTIYNTSSAEQIEYQLLNSDARLIITQSRFLPQVRQAAARVPALAHIIVVDGEGRGEGDEGTATFEEFLAAGAGEYDFEAAWRAVQPDDLLALIFTSGTTGPPKGAQWAHLTIMAQLRALEAALPLPRESLVSYMPMAHAGGRLTAHYLAIPYGPTITCCPEIREMPAYVAEVRPDALLTPTRFWEKLQLAIEAGVDELDEPERTEARRLMVAGRNRARGGEPVHTPALLEPIVAGVGLDRLKAGIIGGAPSAPELSDYFRGIGVTMVEAYGLTEGGLNCFNTVREFKGGTAGKPLPGVELRLERDGEILLRGELVMVGYRKEPALTAETIDRDGWLHTGDIGVIDEDGFLKIVDRKKEIIISAAGKNMSPANIESAIRSESSLIGQVVTIGDGRRYNTALITLDPEAAALYARRLGLAIAELEQLIAEPSIMAEVRAAVDRGNARLSSPESIRKFKLLPRIWMPDSDELTPIGKLKRRAVERKYAEEIESLYAE
jgi:long-chain acyl-CoA synthetase